MFDFSGLSLAELDEIEDLLARQRDFLAGVCNACELGLDEEWGHICREGV